jgi:hypothetical protein
VVEIAFLEFFRHLGDENFVLELGREFLILDQVLFEEVLKDFMGFL